MLAMQVVRVETTCNRRFVGAQIASECIDAVKERIAQGEAPVRDAIQCAGLVGFEDG